ncbi:hypothetical protein ACLBWS_18075 [Brucellaceae bacterium D45D]
MTHARVNATGLPRSSPAQVTGCSFRENGYYALRIRDRGIDVRRCEWSDDRCGIDIFALDNVNIDFTVDDPRMFDRIFYGRFTAIHKEVQA